MSRSFKKTPILKDGRSERVGKKFAHKKVRHAVLPGGKSNRHKRVFNSYDIHDSIEYCSEAEARQKYESGISSEYLQAEYKSADAYINKDWAFNFKRK